MIKGQMPLYRKAKKKESDYIEVKIVHEWHNPTHEIMETERQSKDNPLFYILKIQKGKQRYIKIGTAEKTMKNRLGQADYKKYSTVKMLYVAEVACDKKNNKEACYHIEDLTKSAWRELKGLGWIKNDRFTYFQIPKKVPIQLTLENRVIIDL